ncbi:hypothetical protein N7522_001258 [Penicillium canescens]|nr:hypothetical protein N7522_001258 [Penicillium canescens]
MIRSRLRRRSMLLLLNNLVPIHSLRLRINTHNTVHHEPTTLAELVDSTHGIDSAVQRAPRIEVLLDGRQEVLARADLGVVIRRVDPWVLEGFVGGHSRLGVDC